MIALHPPVRTANAADARELADLVNFAGEGLPLHVWGMLAQAGQDPWDVGRSRQAEKARDGKIVVIDPGNGAVASLNGYAIGAEPEPIGDDFPELFRPLQELENQALGSWYVNVLACYPEYRGCGHGSSLLGLAEQMAQDENLKSMSLIVANNNSGARRLYKRRGYQETATCPCNRDGSVTETEYWILLTKPL